jgi:hypothetical protein
MERSTVSVGLAAVSVVALTLACSDSLPAGPEPVTAIPTPAPAPAPAAGTVEGRVLWHEQPVAGARVHATDEYNFSSRQYGMAITDGGGHFSIPNVPPGQQYLYAFGNQPFYWVAAVTPFVMPPEAGVVAPDTYLCRGFNIVSPADGEVLYTPRPVLRWEPYLDAVNYAVRVLPDGQNMFVFSRGDRDARLATPTAQVGVDLAPGKYRWRADAFNSQGHIIGCTYYPRSFVISVAERVRFEIGSSIPVNGLGEITAGLGAAQTHDCDAEHSGGAMAVACGS